MKILLYGSMITGLLLTSCSKDFLDLQPISSVTTGNFYQNANDIKNAVAVYTLHCSFPALIQATIFLETSVQTIPGR